MWTLMSDFGRLATLILSCCLIAALLHILPVWSTHYSITIITPNLILDYGTPASETPTLSDATVAKLHKVDSTVPVIL